MSRVHATGTAAALLLDLTLGQDTFAPGSLAAERRSGVARGAAAFGVSSNDYSWVQTVAGGLNVDIISRSASNDNFLCTGQSLRDRQFNTLYEDGFAVFASTGNNSNNGGCSVAAPASAMGTFAVSQYDMSTGVAEIDPLASRGGDSGRTIVDLSAPAPGRFPAANHDSPFVFGSTLCPFPGTPPAGLCTNDKDRYYGADWDLDDSIGELNIPRGAANWTGDAGVLGGSSWATPTTAGAAGLFLEWGRTTYGSMMAEPGIIYSNMLLMGDGRNESGTVSSYGYDDVWGAGLLHMRMFDSVGLDDPSHYETGSVCVEDGSAVLIPLRQLIPGGANYAIPQDVDVLKFVTWLYDPNQDTGGHVDNYGIDLERYSSSGWINTGWDHGSDHKKRMIEQPMVQASYRVRVSGFDIRTDNFDGCGTNANRVYFAFFWEDSDREAAENLTCIATEG